MRAQRNLFLVGPMGAGKSTLGRRLARALDLAFVDADQEIERRTGASIPLIFDVEGEAGFRRREKRVIEELTAREGVVLATGGGAVLDPDNRRLLASRGTVIYLKASIDQLLERTARDRHRPLLQTEDRRGRMEELLRQRGPLYEAVADLVVETTGRSARQVEREILRRLREREEA